MLGKKCIPNSLLPIRTLTVHLYYKTHYEQGALPKRVAKLIDEDFIGRVMATFKANDVLNLKASSEKYGLVIYPKK